MDKPPSNQEADDGSLDAVGLWVYVITAAQTACICAEPVWWWAASITRHRI